MTYLDVGWTLSLWCAWWHIVIAADPPAHSAAAYEYITQSWAQLYLKACKEVDCSSMQSLWKETPGCENTLKLLHKTSQEMMQWSSTCNPHGSVHGAHMIVSTGQTVSQTNKCPHSWYMTTNLQHSTSSAGVPYIWLCRSQYQSEHYSMRLKQWRRPLEHFFFPNVCFSCNFTSRLEGFFQELESVFKKSESIF